jgi:SOS-response transcriptional repressor LexA
LVALAFLEAHQRQAHPNIGLTELQTKVLTFVDNYRGAWGFSPSYREIAEGVGLPLGQACEVIHQCIERGALSFVPGRKRSLSVSERV